MNITSICVFALCCSFALIITPLFREAFSLYFGIFGSGVEVRAQCRPLEFFPFSTGKESLHGVRFVYRVILILEKVWSIREDIHVGVMVRGPIFVSDTV